MLVATEKQASNMKNSNESNRGPGEASLVTIEGQDLVRSAQLRYNWGGSVRRIGTSVSSFQVLQYP